MPTLSYRQPGLSLTKGGGGAADQQIRDLQRDLRQLGYLRQGIDGAFGWDTANESLDAVILAACRRRRRCRGRRSREEQ